ncbi:YdiU family protein [Caenimonas koreensis DSM 17982]|uniref:Protein nucleotidyltransferase YdiU n=1 Tax=Caenimonas koreensis DSM 17982 TaxID=1121255 RepID=A0A844AVW9_9BURK|nr:YdiU family protein [Caenimonas koreensis]MRD48535.1 YdiU family protein [Caenimonas koreensis DSM 17982]
MIDLAPASTSDTPEPLWLSSFASLGSAFFTELQPTHLPEPYLVGANTALAGQLGLRADWLQSPAGVSVFTGNTLMPGMRPLASVYSGHQFGVWAGQLGDGRAILLGELTGAEGPQEIQLKGSGLTPYSRMGDGRAVLRSSIREFLCSEAMHGLGIPTTRALCVTGSEQRVRREEVETAAVVTRVAPSFVRFGHFEHFSANGKEAELRQLADFVIDRDYPACRTSERFGGNAYACFLEAVSERTAAMVAHWQSVGFCHGVMNTDNMSILGLTIDYGPFQFLDGFDPGHICNHSDERGRYAFNRQPNVAYWNLYCLGQALLPLIGDQDVAIAALESYKAVFPRELQTRMRAKLGLADERDGDVALIEDIFRVLAKSRCDYTIFWRRLSRFVGGAPVDSVRDLFLEHTDIDAWIAQYQQRLAGSVPLADASAAMLRVNPKFVLRNHLAEIAIRQAKSRDFSEVELLLDLLSSPFDEHPLHEDKAGFAPEWASQIEISCSS